MIGAFALCRQPDPTAADRQHLENGYHSSPRRLKLPIRHYLVSILLDLACRLNTSQNDSLCLGGSILTNFAWRKPTGAREEVFATPSSI